MSTSQSTAEFIAEQIKEAGAITFRKMFGEYLVYCNGKPIFLLCDDTLYVKVLPQTTEFVRDKTTGSPYKGAKELHN